MVNNLRTGSIINICEAQNCQSEGTEQIALDVGNESLTFLICKNCVKEFKDAEEVPCTSTKEKGGFD